MPERRGIKFILPRKIRPSVISRLRCTFSHATQSVKQRKHTTILVGIWTKEQRQLHASLPWIPRWQVLISPRPQVRPPKSTYRNLVMQLPPAKAGYARAALCLENAVDRKGEEFSSFVKRWTWQAGDHSIPELRTVSMNDRHLPPSRLGFTDTCFRHRKEQIFGTERPSWRGYGRSQRQTVRFLPVTQTLGWLFPESPDVQPYFHSVLGRAPAGREEEQNRLSQPEQFKSSTVINCRKGKNMNRANHPLSQGWTNPLGKTAIGGPQQIAKFPRNMVAQERNQVIFIESKPCVFTDHEPPLRSDWGRKSGHQWANGISPSGEWPKTVFSNPR